MLRLLRRRRCCVPLCIWPACACALSAPRAGCRGLCAHAALSFSRAVLARGLSRFAVHRLAVGIRAQATTVCALRGITSSVIVSSSGIAMGLPF